jgi:hypothetical protein
MTRVVLQERDRINTPRIIVVSIGSLIIFALGVLAAWWMLDVRTRRFQPQGPPPPPALAGEPKIGMVEQRPFAIPSDFMDRQRQRLSSYGWVDRARGQVHIPIERAMQIVVEEANK